MQINYSISLNNDDVKNRFFKEILDKLLIKPTSSTVKNRVNMMQYLSEKMTILL